MCTCTVYMWTIGSSDSTLPACTQVQEIVRLAPRDRQTMLFSATMTEDVEKLVKVSLRQPVRLAANAAGAAPDALSQEIVRLKVCAENAPVMRTAGQ